MEKETEERILRLRQVREKITERGGLERIARQKEKGKLSVYERIAHLLDPGSFVEWGMLVGHDQGLPGEGVVTGQGTIDGRMVCVYAQDPTVLGGSIGAIHGFKMYRTVERAMELRVPLIGLHDSPGARTVRLGEEGALGDSSEKGGGSIFYPNTQASGIVPQISAILGSCAGISVYSPALNDFIFMVEGISHMFITGPRIVKSVMGEDITMDELGGAKVHARVSGVADFRMRSELDCFQTIRKLLSFLPLSCYDRPPVRPYTGDITQTDDQVAEIIPADAHKFYNMHKLIKRLVDDGEFLEIKAEFAQEMIVGFGRLGGYPVGIIANQPMVRAGALTVDSSDKEARFLRFCDCFNIPLVLLVDTPAYMPGSAQEHAGIIRHGAKVLYALCEATVPRIVVVLRKAYGGGNLGMGVHPGLATDFVFYWPTAEVGVLGAEQSVDLFYVDEIKKAADPALRRQQLIQEYRAKYANPFYEASRNPYMEDIIEPRETRYRLIKTFELLRNKRREPKNPKRHGNIPL
ncbi:MAG: acyl-CoA carboxylase subunit beta [Chloroflexi bacterium]|nr:acyl-CoA carboxylase subunit beta [Chloroflexota bacterium]